MVQDPGAVIYYQLKNLAAKLKNANSSEPTTKAHYNFLYQIIKQNIEL